jgi:hypothetical protein
MTLAKDKVVRLWDVNLRDVPTVAPKGELLSRAAIVCRDRLSQSIHAGSDQDAGNAELIYTSRAVAPEDVFAFPVLEDRLGDDVCASMLEPPPWWHALVFWR